MEWEKKMMEIAEILPGMIKELEERESALVSFFVKKLKRQIELNIISEDTLEFEIDSNENTHRLKNKILESMYGNNLSRFRLNVEL